MKRPLDIHEDMGLALLAGAFVHGLLLGLFALYAIAQSIVSEPKFLLNGSKGQLKTALGSGDDNGPFANLADGQSATLGRVCRSYYGSLRCQCYTDRPRGLFSWLPMWPALPVTRTVATSLIGFLLPA